MAPSAVQSGSVLPPDTPPAKKAAAATATPTPLGAAQAARDAALARFEARNPRSEELHRLATSSMPGGNTRTQLHTPPFPVFMKSGKGYQVTSEDGHTPVPPRPLARSPAPFSANG